MVAIYVTELKMVALAASHLPVRFNWVDVENEDGQGKGDERCVRIVEEKVVYSTETWNHDDQDKDRNEDTCKDILKKEDGKCSLLLRFQRKSNMPAYQR